MTDASLGRDQTRKYFGGFDLLCIRVGYDLDDTFPYNSPLWYLDILIQMYVLYFVVTFFMRDFPKWVSATMSGVLSAVGLFIVLNGGKALLAPLNATGRGLYCFFAGILLAESYRLAENRPFARRAAFAASAFLPLLTICTLHARLPNDHFNEIFTYALWVPLIYITYYLTSLGKVHADLNSAAFTASMMGLILIVSAISCRVEEWSEHDNGVGPRIDGPTDLPEGTSCGSARGT